MMIRRTAILTLEGAAERSWPASDHGEIDGWRLHAGRGKVMRTNSCWPLAWRGTDARAAIAQVEAWYGARGLPPTFKIVDECCAPADLVDLLIARGYAPVKETLVLTAAVSESPDTPDDVEIDSRFTPDFSTVLLAAGADIEDSRERAEILARIPGAAAFAIRRQAGIPVAGGVAVLERDMIGIMAMRTAHNERRKGHGAAVLSALLGWAAARKAGLAWLQVEADILSARALYAKAGFVAHHAYRYWVR
jgi:GNAT superfamily N-acetyltransferase